MVRTTAAALGLILLASGCWRDWDEEGRASSPEPRGEPRAALVEPLDRGEQDWITSLGEWASISPAGAGDETCAEVLREQVGDAPSKRLERLQRLAWQACRSFGVDRDSVEGQRLVDTVMEGIFAFDSAGGLARDLPVRGGASDVSRIEPLLSRVVSTVTGVPAEVRCWAPDEWDALTDTFWPYGEEQEGESEIAGYADAGSIHLVGTYCRPLVDLHGGQMPTGESAQSHLAFSVSLLAHEGEHHTGEPFEARAECFALQRMRLFARELGATRAYAESLVRLEWTQSYPNLAETYRSRECRDGGELDLDPDREGFP